MLKYDELKEKPREFLSVTSLTDEEFQVLLPTFEKCYQLLSPPKPKVAKKKNQRARGGGRKAKPSDLSNKLLFILAYQKTAPLQTLHGLQFGISQGGVRVCLNFSNNNKIFGFCRSQRPTFPYLTANNEQLTANNGQLRA